MAYPENNGWLVTRRCFMERDGLWLELVPRLAKATGKALASAEQMCEPRAQFERKVRSPLDYLCEMIRERHEEDLRQGVAYAADLAAYPLDYYKQLKGDVRATGDPVLLQNELILCVAEANKTLACRFPSALSLNELRLYREHLMNARAKAGLLIATIDAQIAESEASFKGVPIEGERLTAARR